MRAVLAGPSSSICSGGAKDTESFKRSIGRGFLPLASSIEYEGLFNEFYFDIGRERDHIFSPKYSYCKSEDPFSHQSEHYLAIGLTSKYDGDGLQIHGRNSFNLVVSIDISGSMAAPLGKVTEGGDNRSKMEITVNSVFSIMALLRPGDRFGVVTFNDDISVLQELELFENIDIPQLKSKIVSLTPNGGTALSSALKKSTRMFDEVKKDEKKYKESENTIVVLTDVVPSAKDASTSTFVNTVLKNSLSSLYTTFIGIGSEFSSDTLKKLGKIRSCNYYSVHSAADFKKIIERDFIYILSPVAFNISLSINSSQFVVERVYGSPGNELPSESGEMLKIECISPSPVDENDKTKGGIVLAKLKLNSALLYPGILNCKLQYEDRTGKIHMDEQKVDVLLTQSCSLYIGEAARKSVLLTRYVNISKHWILDETRRTIAIDNEDITNNNNNNNNEQDKVHQHTISLSTGITPPPLDQAAKQQRRIKFCVDLHYAKLFTTFVSHFKEEITEIGDPLLEPFKDVLTLEKMANFKQTERTVEETQKKPTLEAIDFYVMQKGEKIEFDVSKILSNIAAEGRYSLLNSLWDQVESLAPQALMEGIKSAGANGHPRILRRLLSLYKKKLAIISIDNILPALKETVKKGQLECVQELLTSVPDCDMGTHGSALLIDAYNYGKSLCAKYLIERGATALGITLADLEKDLNPVKTNLNELDLVFCCDCTGSMGSYLASAQKSIISIASSIAAQGECDVRFGLVKYRDHPEQNNGYVTEEHDFTRDTKRMKAYVDTMSASGGGDTPECLVDGMEKCSNMDFRPTATKIVCIISDAPPHGLHDFHDNFPEGCPCGHDPLEVARTMAERGIVIYTLGAGVTGYDTLKPFLVALAQLTEGQYAPLSGADLLSSVIVGGSIEEIELKKLTSLVEEEWKNNIVPLSLDLDESLLVLSENLQKKDVRVKQMSFTEEEDDRVNVIVGASNLEEANKQLIYYPKNEKNFANNINNSAEPKYKLEEKIISLKQVTRIWNRLNIAH